MIRRIYHGLLKDHFAHEGNMVILAGPRQSGKTTTAVQYDPKSTSYWNWDDSDDRALLRSSPQHFFEAAKKRDGLHKVIVLDEIHKNRKWRGWLKGLYDKHGNDNRIIVTGSARLNVFRRGGDSLLGRYYFYHHHPLSLGELLERPFTNDLFRKSASGGNEEFAKLLRFGGFPRPYLAGRETSHAKWTRMRRELLIKEDMRDLSKIEDVAAIELLVTLLGGRIGGLLNMQNLANDLSVSVDSIRRWIKLLEALYYVYLIPPYTKNVKRSLVKTPKPFLWDWSEVTDEAARFENMIASHLYKSVHYWTDTGHGEFKLCFIRDKEKREVDFLVTKDNKPFLLVECKKSERAISSSLFHFNEILKPRYACQVIRDMKPEGRFLLDMKSCEAISAVDFCKILV
ncbi:MAG: ATP-binding protein [Deltaproteobacteria bacterium]|nr:ATP-binding protein [Deltaproteobacteria bacterium]